MRTLNLSQLFCFIITIFLLTACDKTENISTEVLIGKWIEKESDEIIQFGGTNHILEFTNDTFFLERRYWTDALDPNNECVNGHTAYFKGTYEISADQLILEGQSTDANFEPSPPECNRSATYEATFEMKQVNDEVLILNPDEEIYNQIRLERDQ